MNTAEEMLKEKDAQIISVSPDQTVMEAVQVMAERRIGVVLVEKDGDLIGILSERDFLRHSADEQFDSRAAKVGDYMSAPLKFATHDTELPMLQEMFLGLYVRHLPIKKGDRFIGMLSIGDVLRADLLDKDRDIKELKKMASWQYYDNWGWDRKKRLK
jgi:CBS domain-containing protein